jgi:hypothetical protein
MQITATFGKSDMRAQGIGATDMISRAYADLQTVKCSANQQSVMQYQLSKEMEALIVSDAKGQTDGQERTVA